MNYQNISSTQEIVMPKLGNRQRLIRIPLSPDAALWHVETAEEAIQRIPTRASVGPDAIVLRISTGTGKP